MKKIFFTALLFSISMFSCKNYAVSTIENPGCKTAIIGEYHNPVTWKGRTPALITSKNKKTVIYGKIIEKTKEGFLFDAEKTRRSDPEPAVYEIEDITCLIDENGKVIYGNIPNMYNNTAIIELDIIDINNQDADIISFKIIPNAGFSYCVPPGNYKVEEIRFYYQNRMDYFDFSKNIPDIYLYVKEGNSNYIGDIYYNDSVAVGTPLFIETRAGGRPSDVNAVIMFGLVGALVNEEMKSNEIQYYKLIIANEEVKYDSVRVSLFSFEKK